MKTKVDETRANLTALNDEQLQTTTRLTILQNHQLTTELDYRNATAIIFALSSLNYKNW